MTRKKSMMTIVAVGALCFGSMAVARADEEGTTGKQGATEGSTRQMPEQVRAGQLMNATFKVEKVDTSNRDLTLVGENGKPFTVRVPEDVTRLENVKKGDHVDLSFYESVAVSLKKPGAEPVGEKRQAFEERTPGALPGGMAGERITTTAKITKIDKGNNEVTIESPTGVKNTIKVESGEAKNDVKSLKVGDKIKATYTVAMATSVTPRGKM